MSTDPIFLIAENEFSRILRNPLVIVVSIVMFLLMVINAAGCSVLLPDLIGHGFETAFLVGIGNVFYVTSLFFTFLSMCLGIVSLANDRATRSLGLLLSKPVYRRDVLIGKFAGINTVLLVLIAFVFLINVSSLIIAYRGPEDMMDTFLRLISYFFSLSMNCALTVSIVFFIGIIFKNLADILIISVSYLYLGWFAGIQFIKDISLINPMGIYNSIIFGGGSLYLLDETVSYSLWLNNALPFLLIIVIETTGLFLINCMLFNKEDT
mgnify:CR=1 FL=1